MRPIARQSTRLASCNQVRQPYPLKRAISQRRRTFHVSVQRAQEPRSPNSTPDHQTSIDERRDSHRRAENGSKKAEQGVEQENGETKPATSTSTYGTRRSLRQKRMNEVPKPPPIPDWFLEHNVKLLKDSPGLGVNTENAEVIRCVDTETGHTLFTVPYHAAWPKKGSRRDFETQTPVLQPQFTAAESATGLASATKSPQSKEAALGQDFFDHKFQTQPSRRPRTHKLDTAKPFVREEWSAPPTRIGADYYKDFMRWSFLETETSARAAMDLPRAHQNSPSFAADRVDLSLHFMDSNSPDEMDTFIQGLARVVQADVIRIDANDFADLTADYVGQGRDEPGSFSNLGYDVFDGYEASTPGKRSHSARQPSDIDEENEFDEDEDEMDSSESDVRGGPFGSFGSTIDLRKALQDGRSELSKLFGGSLAGLRVGVVHPQPPKGTTSRPSRSDAAELNRDDARLAALMDHLLDAPTQKTPSSRTHDTTSKVAWHPKSDPSVKTEDGDDLSKSYQRIVQYWRTNPAFWYPSNANPLLTFLNVGIDVADSGKPAIKLEVDQTYSSDSTAGEKRRTIVHIPELRNMCESQLGNSVVQRLVKVVQKRRRAGEHIIVVGTTAMDVPGPYHGSSDMEDLPFRPISIPPFFNFSLDDNANFDAAMSRQTHHFLRNPVDRRVLEVNLRHIQSMLRRLRPDDGIELLSEYARGQLDMPGMDFLTERVLSLDQVQRLSLISIGLCQSHTKADILKPIHVAVAGWVLTRSDLSESTCSTMRERKQAERSGTNFNSNATRDAGNETAESRIERLKKSCNAHETRLLSGVVDPRNLKTHFTDVHAPAETIEALKTLTSLSLLRPDAFKYGVLANDRLPGLLLYGPPGTGKTLLAKAVAKESKATVLEVSGAQIYEKYVGEGEKMVRAVFSLAKKLTPCVVFIDEADAIFGSRSNAGNRNTHREIINQFLREWDGMDDHSVFMMVATNRPFDLDDAVLRRLPRRLLIDLPVAKDRESILGIHLKNEELDSSVSLNKLAEQTPLYSGSDLKNLSVAAALACVREENELAELSKEDKDFKLPEKRTLTSKHFDKALAEISASINEDMASLSAIRRFDEQYGDRKGRRKKTSYGFGGMDGVVDEGAARVRQPSSSPPPS